MKTVKADNRSNNLVNRIGIALSGLCLVHCILISLAFLLLPFVRITLFESHSYFHEIMFVLVVAAAASACYFGYRVHSDLKPVLWFGVGVILIGIGAFAGHHDAIAEMNAHAHEGVDVEWQSIVTIFGSLAMIRGHLINHSNRHKAAHDDCPSCHNH